MSHEEDEPLIALIAPMIGMAAKPFDSFCENYSCEFVFICGYFFRLVV